MRMDGGRRRKGGLPCLGFSGDRRRWMGARPGAPARKCDVPAKAGTFARFAAYSVGAECAAGHIDTQIGCLQSWEILNPINLKCMAKNCKVFVVREKLYLVAHPASPARTRIACASPSATCTYDDD